ncbi:MAG: DUF2478 domain-containing protein [Mangrovicoccus sp.]
MKIGYLKSRSHGETDALLAGLAAELQHQGIAIAGLVQSRAPGPDSHPCDMDLTVIPSGQVITIAQGLGAGAKGCRLDPEALETAALEVEASLDQNPGQNPALLILNKFGPQECHGRGFCAAIASAIAKDIPVLTAVNDLNMPGFTAFTDGQATELPAELDQLLAWATGD